MNSRAIPVIASLLFVGALATHPARADDVVIADFGGLIQKMTSDVYIKPFGAENGINVTEDTRDYGIGVVKAKIDGGSNLWDVVAIEDLEALQGCEEGWLQKLDWSKIAEKDALLPNSVKDCAVGKIVYNIVLTYSSKRTTNAPTSWADFWDTKKWPGKRSMEKNPRGQLEIALLADGVKPEDIYKVLSTPEGVDRAFAKLDELKPNIIWWAHPGLAREMLMNGESVMGTSYDSGNNFVNMNENAGLQSVYSNPIISTDYWGIVAGAKHPEAAEKFLNYASSAKKQAELASKMAIGVTNTASFSSIDPKVLSILPTNPDNIKTGVQSDPAFWLDHFDELNRRFSAWAGQ